MPAYEVIVVGGGPVGVALAVELGLRGISCALIERHKSPQRIPKGQNLTQRTLEHFYFWGIADELRARRLLPPGYPIGGVTAYGDLMSPYWFSQAGRGAVQPYYYQPNERLPQYLTEEVLRERLRDIPNVTTYFGWTAESVQQNTDGVRVTITETAGPGREETSYEWGGFIDASEPSKTEGANKRILEAAYIVGADGARSMVREQSGIGREGPDWDQRMVLAVFRSRELHEGLKRFPELTTYRVLRPELQGYWQFFGRVDVGESWFFHAPVPQSATVDSYDFHGLLQEAAGFKFHCTLDHVGFWDLRIMVANTYRQGRAFIVGDACHSHPPYGGFGLNSGLEDAVNLGWKLAAVLRGWGSERLLDSYTEERRPIFVETGEAMIKGGIEKDRDFLERHSPNRDREDFERAWQELGEMSNQRQQSYEPHYEGSSVVLGPPGAACSVHGSHSFAAQVGHHLAPQALSSGRNTFEELGGGYTLLAFDANEDSIKAFEHAAETVHAPLKVVRDSFEGDRRKYESPLVLVRPDQYVAWIGDASLPDAKGIFRKVTGLG
ncbi:MAG: FAD-dependent monooxygenase [Nitrospirales bacterium]